MKIDKTSVVHPKAKLASGVKLGPFCSIGENVQLGKDVELVSHVVIGGRTKIGKGTKIFPFASIGNEPQDLKYNGENTKLIIGDGNTIREYTTINTGTIGGGGITKIGDNSLLMIGVHIAHDCVIGNNVVIANSAAIAGHAEIGDDVIIGGNCGVQQFTRIGKLAMIGGMTGVSRDVIPFGVSLGNRNYLDGINIVGLRRRKVPNKDIMSLTDAYKEIFKTESLNDNLNKLNGNFKDNIYVNEVIEFINKDKKRPICTPFSK